MRRAIEDGDAASLEAELRKRTSEQDGCWVWNGVLKDGYPVASIGPKTKRVAIHRAVIECVRGSKLGTQAAHHKCANSACVNPEHLQPVTERENTAEMLARRSYLARINALEEALRNLNPSHELLTHIPVASE